MAMLKIFSHRSRRQSDPIMLTEVSGHLAGTHSDSSVDTHSELVNCTGHTSVPQSFQLSKLCRLTIKAPATNKQDTAMGVRSCSIQGVYFPEDLARRRSEFPSLSKMLIREAGRHVVKEIVWEPPDTEQCVIDILLLIRLPCLPSGQTFLRVVIGIFVCLHFLAVALIRV